MCARKKRERDDVHNLIEPDLQSVGTEVLALHSPASGRDILAVTRRPCACPRYHQWTRIYTDAQTHVLIQRSHLAIHSHLCQGFDGQDDVDQDGGAKVGGEVVTDPRR